jgi:hypothetical protein
VTGAATGPTRTDAGLCAAAAFDVAAPEATDVAEDHEAATMTAETQTAAPTG